MQLQIEKLGKVAVTVEKGYWRIDKDYDKLVIVQIAGEFGTYISRKPVPAGTELTNRNYWIPFSSVKESIILDYKEFTDRYQTILDKYNENFIGIDDTILQINSAISELNIKASEAIKNNELTNYKLNEIDDIVEQNKAEIRAAVSTIENAQIQLEKLSEKIENSLTEVQVLVTDAKKSIEENNALITESITIANEAKELAIDAKDTNVTLINLVEFFTKDTNKPNSLVQLDENGKILNTLIPDEIYEKLQALKTELQTLLNDNPTEAIENFNEIIKFLENIEDTESLSSIIAGLQKTISDVDTNASTKITQLKQEINNIINTQISNINTQINSINEELDNIDNELDTINNDITDANTSITNLSNSVDTQVKTLTDKITEVETNSSTVEDLDALKVTVTNLSNSVQAMKDGDLTLVTPTISSTWQFKESASDTIITSLNTTSNAAIVEKGCKASYSGIWKWTAASGKKNPTTMSVTNATTWKISDDELPRKSGVNSPTFTKADITTNTSFGVTLYAPKEGLMVSGTKVLQASGNDSTSATASVTFKDRIYFGSVQSNSITEDILKGLSTELVTTHVATKTFAAGGYMIYAYPSTYADLQSIWAGGINQTGAFTKGTITITNIAKVQVTYKYYISNNKTTGSTSVQFKNTLS